MSMVFILPLEGVSLNEVEEAMKGFAWDEFYGKGSRVSPQKKKIAFLSTPHVISLSSVFFFSYN